MNQGLDWLMMGSSCSRVQWSHVCCTFPSEASTQDRILPDWVNLTFQYCFLCLGIQVSAFSLYGNIVNWTLPLPNCGINRVNSTWDHLSRFLKLSLPPEMSPPMIFQVSWNLCPPLFKVECQQVTLHRVVPSGSSKGPRPVHVGKHLSQDFPSRLPVLSSLKRIVWVHDLQSSLLLGPSLSHWSTWIYK